MKNGGFLYAFHRIILGFNPASSPLEKAWLAPPGADCGVG